MHTDMRTMLDPQAAKLPGSQRSRSQQVSVCMLCIWWTRYVSIEQQSHASLEQQSHDRRAHVRTCGYERVCVCVCAEHCLINVHLRILYGHNLYVNMYVIIVVSHLHIWMNKPEDTIQTFRLLCMSVTFVCYKSETGHSNVDMTACSYVSFVRRLQWRTIV